MLLKSFYLAVGIQAAFGIPGVLSKSERFYDFSGALTHIALALYSIKSPLTTQKIIGNAISVGWALRLGGFLAYRMYKSGSDTRFDDIKQSKLRFASAWFIQAIWCTLIQSPLILMNAYSPVKTLGTLDKVLAAGWVGSVILEATADIQKYLYKQNRKESDPGFTNVGLWKYSQHPNYFFEMTTWAFAWMYCCRHLPTKHGLYGLSSPLFTTFILLFVSGIPHSKTPEKYGKDPRYQVYEKSTSTLIPWFPSAIKRD